MFLDFAFLTRLGIWGPLDTSSLNKTPPARPNIGFNLPHNNNLINIIKLHRGSRPRVFFYIAGGGNADGVGPKRGSCRAALGKPEVSGITCSIAHPVVS